MKLIYKRYKQAMMNEINCKLWHLFFVLAYFIEHVHR